MVGDGPRTLLQGLRTNALHRTGKHGSRDDCNSKCLGRGTGCLVLGVMGVLGNVVSAVVNEFVIPNDKQTWGNIRKLADAPEATRHVSFKSVEYRSS